MGGPCIHSRCGPSICSSRWRSRCSYPKCSAITCCVWTARRLLREEAALSRASWWTVRRCWSLMLKARAAITAGSCTRRLWVRLRLWGCGKRCARRRREQPASRRSCLQRLPARYGLHDATITFSCSSRFCACACRAPASSPSPGSWAGRAPGCTLPWTRCGRRCFRARRPWPSSCQDLQILRDAVESCSHCLP